MAAGEMRERREVTLPLTVEDMGKTWRLFTASFGGAEGAFGIFFYAISMEHAAMVVEDMKATLKLDGQIEAIIDGPAAGDRAWKFRKPG